MACPPKVTPPEPHGGSAQGLSAEPTPSVCCREAGADATSAVHRKVTNADVAVVSTAIRDTCQRKLITGIGCGFFWGGWGLWQLVHRFQPHAVPHQPPCAVSRRMYCSCPSLVNLPFIISVAWMPP